MLKRLATTSLLLVVGLGISSGMVGFKKSLSFIEQTPPQIEIEAAQKQLGITPVVVSVSTRDHGAFSEADSGIKNVKLLGIYNGTTTVLDSKSWDNAEELRQFTYTIDINKLGITSDQLTLVVSAEDFSLLHNSAEAKLTFDIDRSNPQLVPPAKLLYLRPGGSGVANIEASDNALDFVGVKQETNDNLQAQEFPAYQLLGQTNSSDTDSTPDIDSSGHYWRAYFPVPFGTQQQGSFRLVARDLAGNTTSVPLSYAIIPRTRPNSTMTLSQGYLQSRVLPMAIAHGFEASSAVDPEQGMRSLAESFRFVNEGLRNEANRRLKAISLNSDKEQLWQGAFSRPMNAATTSRYGEARTYLYEKEQIGQSFHDGIDLASIKQDVVRASNSGKVVFCEDLLIYGNTIVLDHGQGIQTIYAHLSKFQVAQGDLVDKNQQIATSGSSGLAGGDHLHFEVRIHGESVSPIEWWDSKWIAEHVESEH